MARARGQSRGFTLIELLVVVAILGVLAAAAVPAVNAVTGANARAAAGELAGASRYLFDTAALRHQTCRLALDLDHAAWWPECTEGRAVPGAEASKFGAFKDRLAGKRSLPGSTRFADVWAEHLRDPATRGMAYVYFHPNGRAEAARVVLADGDNVYSVVTQPFTGRARVVTGRPELPRS
jgi:general secretion pathway protein H